MSVKNVKVNDFDISTNIYFNSIKKNKSLTKQEENELWNKFHKKKDLSAREKLIKANLKFVPNIAKKFKGCGLPFADIIEEGNIGLIQAIDRFDTNKDNKVISYAVWWIRKCIMEAIEKKSVLDTDDIDNIFTNINNDTDDENESIYDTKQDNYNENILPYEETKLVINKKQLIEELFEGVPERERFIVSDYYGLYGNTPKTLDEIGMELNITKERVRQLNEKALKKMRTNALIKNLTFNI